MVGFVRIVQEGGVFMYPLLLLVALGLVAVPALALGVLTRMRVPAAVWWAVPAALVALGALASALGLSKGLHVLPMVDPTQRSVIAHAATTEGLVPLWVGMTAAAAQLLGGALLAGLASLRAGAGEGGQARQGESWLAAGVGLVLGAACAGGALWLLGERWIHQSLTHVGAEDGLLERGVAMQERASYLGPAGVVLALVIGLVLAVPLLKGRLDRQAMVSVAVAPALVLGLGALLAAPIYYVVQLRAGMVEADLDSVLSTHPDLPTPADDSGAMIEGERPSPPLEERRTEGWVPVDRKFAAGADDRPTLVAPASLPAVNLTEEGGFSPGQRFAVLTRVPAPPETSGRPWTASLGMGQVEMSVFGEQPGDDASGMRMMENLGQGVAPLVVRAIVNGVELDRPQQEPQRVTNPKAAASALRSLPSETWQSSAVLLVPDVSWTLQELVSLCISAQQAASRLESEHGSYGTLSCVVTSAATWDTLLTRRVVSATELSPLSGLTVSPGEPGVTALGDQMIVLGAMDTREIEAVIQRHMVQIQDCYQRGLKMNQDLSGKLSEKFVIARDGSVSKAETMDSTLADATVGDCINRRLLRLEFPKPKGGGIVIVKYPFVFQPR